jgi:hypothetical protein
MSGITIGAQWGGVDDYQNGQNVGVFIIGNMTVAADAASDGPGWWHTFFQNFAGVP